MNLLWFSHILPFPPRAGNLQRSYNLIREMSKYHKIWLVAFNFQNETGERLETYVNELKRLCEGVEVWDLPYSWRGARWWGEVVSAPLVRAPVTCRALWSRRLATRWREVLSNHRGALLHFDSPDLGLYAVGIEGFRKVLNHHNCESAMASRRAEMESNPLKRAYLRVHATKLARLERELCHQFEVNTVVSELDGQTLRARNPRAHVHVVDNGTDTNYFTPGGESEEPKSLVFAGSLDWYPNLSAIRFFLDEIWPLLKQQCPEVRITLAGQNPPLWLLQRGQSDPSVCVAPNPTDIRPLVRRSSVFVCPIRDGGGTRLKILDALAMGKPVVSTSIGCEGLRTRHEENILVADAPDAFARQVLHLLENGPLRRRLAAAGRVLVEEHYSWERISRQLQGAYECAWEGGKCDQRVSAPVPAGAL